MFPAGIFLTIFLYFDIRVKFHHGQQRRSEVITHQHRHQDPRRGRYRHRDRFLASRPDSTIDVSYRENGKCIRPFLPPLISALRTHIVHLKTYLNRPGFHRHPDKGILPRGKCYEIGGASICPFFSRGAGNTHKVNAYNARATAITVGKPR